MRESHECGCGMAVLCVRCHRPPRAGYGRPQCVRHRRGSRRACRPRGIRVSAASAHAPLPAPIRRAGALCAGLPLVASAPSADGALLVKARQAMLIAHVRGCGPRGAGSSAGGQFGTSTESHRCRCRRRPHGIRCHMGLSPPHGDTIRCVLLHRARCAARRACHAARDTLRGLRKGTRAGCSSTARSRCPSWTAFSPAAALSDST
jgi:hypothetical protein